MSALASAVASLLDEHLGRAIGWALVHSLWQGLIAVLLLALALKVLDRKAARLRYAVACVALMLMALAPLATGYAIYRATGPQSPAHQEAARFLDLPDEAPAALPVARAQQSLVPPLFGAPPNLGSPPALRWLAFGWALGVCLSALRLLVDSAGLHALVRSARPAPPAWQRTSDRLARVLRLPRRVRLAESARVAVPCAVGWLRPMILLPASALSGLSPAELEMILAHELAHVRRHDFAVNVAQRVVETLYFYHPGVRWVSKVIRAERENCCDDAAIQACGNPVAYARALTELEALRVEPRPLFSGRRAALSALGGSLGGRVRRLITPRAHLSPGRTAGASLLTFASAVALAGSVSVASIAHAAHGTPVAQVNAATPQAQPKPNGRLPRKKTPSTSQTWVPAADNSDLLQVQHPTQSAPSRRPPPPPEAPPAPLTGRTSAAPGALAAPPTPPAPPAPPAPPPVAAVEPAEPPEPPEPPDLQEPVDLPSVAAFPHPEDFPRAEDFPDPDELSQSFQLDLDGDLHPLSEAQQEEIREQVRQAMESAREAMRSAREQMRQAREQIRAQSERLREDLQASAEAMRERSRELADRGRGQGGDDEETERLQEEARARAERDQARAERERERAQREQERARERAQRDQERARERAERAQERAQEEAQRAQERAERAQERARERAQRDASRAQAGEPSDRGAPERWTAALNVDPDYADAMNRAFGRTLSRGELFGLHSLGVSAEYVAGMNGAGLGTLSPREVEQARAVGVDPEYARSLMAAGAPVKGVRDLVQLRAMGVDASFVEGLHRAGLTRLSVGELARLRALGVDGDFVTSARKAGVTDLSLHNLERLRVRGPERPGEPAED